MRTDQWTATDCTIGPRVNSYFQYLGKGAILFRNPELMNMLEGKSRDHFVRLIF